MLSDPGKTSFHPDHPALASTLKQYVTNGFVDYALLTKKSAELEGYLNSIANIPKAEFNNWNKNEQLALLINLYNAQTIKLVLDHYPVTSIKDIHFGNRGPWDEQVVRLFDKRITLNQLENDSIRMQYENPAIHFALVCAAVSCPPLRNEPYIGEKLDAQLRDQGESFLLKTPSNSIDNAGSRLLLSPIFQRYEGDFIKYSGSVLAYVLTLLPPSIANPIRKADYKIEYTYYDWSLNDIRTGR